MGKSKDLATGETRFVNTAGDTMTGDLGIGVAPAQPLHVFKAGSQGGGMAPLIKVQNDTNNLTGDGAGIEFHGKYQGGEWGFGKIGGTNAGGNFGGALEFHTNTGTGSVSTGFTKKMTIDHNGAVTKPNQPCFIAYTNAGFNTTTATNTIIRNLNGIHLNVGSHYITSGGTASRFVAPITGRYFFGFQLLLSNVATSDDDIHAAFFKNGGQNMYANTRYVGEGANGNLGYGGYLPIIGNTLIQLAANDYIELNLFASGGPIGVHNSEGWSRFYGYLLG